MISFVEGDRAFSFCQQTAVIYRTSAPRQGKAKVDDGFLFGATMDKSLKSIYDKIYYSLNKEKRNQQSKENYDVVKDKLNEHRRNKYSENIEKERERHHEKYMKNPERYKEYWRKRRALQLSIVGDHFTGKQFKELCEKYGNRCLCCGKGNIPLQADHVIPLGPPYSDEISNIQPLCETCNKKKARKYIDYRS